MRRGSFTYISALTFTAFSVIAVIGAVILLFIESLPVWKHSGLSFVTSETWFYRSFCSLWFTRSSSFKELGL